MIDLSLTKSITLRNKKVVKIFYKNKLIWEENILPSGYKKLKYIEAAGKQYINTKFLPNNNSRIIMDCQLTRIDVSNQIVGSRNHASSNVFGLAANENGIWRFGYSKSYKNAGNADTERHIIEINKNIFSVDNIIKYTAEEANFTGEYPVYIGATQTQTRPYTGYVRIYSCKIYDNDTLCFDFIPCLNNNNEAGLYDKISNSFFKNVGTEDFIIG